VTNSICLKLGDEKMDNKEKAMWIYRVFIFYLAGAAAGMLIMGNRIIQIIK
jgi:hypothetical protein